ncbi:hypothetical protein [Hydrogenophaga sp.]|uniref:hypothetical protein n=1 Tax=Hydrogenophaga sp. TaxID=1904254 RepID=UPI00286E96E4|nr:hypothetical protein [Hydrogenophaga sp.]
MDILAHGLWAGLGLAWAHHARPVNRRTLALTVALAVVPDVVQMLPLLVSAVWSADGWTALKSYTMALPGHEPPPSPWLAALTHHLHCVMHSALVAGGVTALLWLWIGRLWIPLLGWWSHIVIDVFTHSADFYPSPVFYPLTDWGFDGLAWNTPGFMVVNYLALAALAVVVWRRRHGART